MDRRGFRIVQRTEGTRGDLAALTAEAERLYWRLMLACDEHGCHRAEPVTVTGNVMVGVKVTVKAVEKAISELVNAGIVVAWIAADGAMWMEIRGFDEGQTAAFLARRHPRIAPPRPDDEPGAPVSAGVPVAPTPPPAEAVFDAQTSDGVQRVFDHWSAGEKRTGGNSRPILTPDRRKRIKARLDDGFTVEQLCECIDGFHGDPFHLGENDRDTRYTDIATILKDARKVDAGIAKCKRNAPGGPQRRSSLVRPQAGGPGE